MINWIHQNHVCKHPAKHYVVQTNEYRNGQKDSRVFCALCGKVILPASEFQGMKDLLTPKGAPHE